jgi:predicted aconitase with swiveling domain
MQSYAREMAEAKGWTRLMTNSAKLVKPWMLHDMRARGIVPRALIFNRVNPIIAQGAAFGGVALVDRFAGDVTQLFRTGDMLHVDPAAGLVEILNRDA